MTIDILCKVVDNWGDVGVVYRLAKALSEAEPSLRLRIVVDDPAALRAFIPELDAGAALQEVRGWSVASGPGAAAAFRTERPRVAVECFACGRPGWYEEILFDPEDAGKRLIVDLEYLTAEDFSAEFHRLPSLTRSEKVRKALFMPGFAPGTGGLILDRRFRSLREAYLGTERQTLRARLFERLSVAAAPGAFAALVFSYERGFGSFIADLAAFGRERPALALVAAGKSAAPFLDAWREAGKPFPAVALPFLDQEAWDEVLLAADFAVVRGEESLSRAALSGRPFLWHAYPLEGGHQLVKVRALLERLRPRFDPKDFGSLERLWLGFNGGGGAENGRLLDVLRRCGGETRFGRGFRSWSESLLDLGDLARNLLTLIREIG